MNLSSAILATLAYHDIFDYPLTQEEVHKYLVGKRSNLVKVESVLGGLIIKKIIGKSGKYYLLKGRKKIVQLRIKRKGYSKVKTKKAKLFATFLKFIPSAKLVAVSGALAMDNSHRRDDIDLVIVTQKNKLWTTRFLANLLLLPFKRDPAGQKISDRACLNMFLDESDLSIKDHNMYTAHEICQMKLIWDRDNTYSKFLRKNSWIKNDLPNWRPNVERLKTNDKRKKRHETLDISRFALVTEKLLRSFQLWYMKNKLTTERISATQLFFHPKNTQEKVLAEYKKRLNKL